MSANNAERSRGIHRIHVCKWRAVSRALRACAASLALIACNDSRGEEPPAKWPEGTVLAVERVPISASDVDEGVPAIAIIEPKFVVDHLRRLSLTQIALPRAVARALAGEEARAKAMLEMESLRERVLSGKIMGPSPDGSTGTSREGGWKQLGLVGWGAAMQLEIGKWSPVLEEIGRFVMVRPLERRERGVPAATEFKLDVVEVRYGFATAPEIDAAYDRLKLVVVDPAWRTLVPETFLYRMGAREP